MLTTPTAVVAIHQPKRKRGTLVVMYGCARLCLVSRPDTRTSRFLFTLRFRIKQVLNLQLPLFVTIDRCYSKCSGVGRVQQAAKGVCV